MKTLNEIKEILKKNSDELREKFHIKEIGIFGSYVIGKQKKTSDVDMLVELEEPVSLLGLVKIENYLSDLLGVKVDLIPKKDLRAELKDEILKEVVNV